VKARIEVHMTAIDSMNSMFGFEEIGICISTPHKKILFQNDACKLTCGNQLLKTCNLCKGVTFQETQHHVFPGLSKTTAMVGEKQCIANQLCDIYQYKEKDKKNLTVLYPVDKEISKYYLYFKEKNFTPRELEIGLLILEKKTNHKLFISKATLKTHLNHMYQKCPSLKSVRFNKKVDLE
jgi:hypothetical protein